MYGAQYPSHAVLCGSKQCHHLLTVCHVLLVWTRLARRLATSGPAAFSVREGGVEFDNPLTQLVLGKQWSNPPGVGLDEAV